MKRERLATALKGQEVSYCLKFKSALSLLYKTFELYPLPLERGFLILK